LQTRGKKPDGSMWRVALEKPLSSERSMHKIITINRSEPFAGAKLRAMMPWIAANQIVDQTKN
jgi:hypothetical protein